MFQIFNFEKQVVDYIDQTRTFWDAYNAREEQTWQLPHVDVFVTDFFTIKKFTHRPYATEAVFVNPPRAGHHSNIAQLVIEYYIKNTNYEVFSSDHHSATQETKNYGIEEVVSQVDCVYNCIPFKKIHLAGLCQGGWGNVIWAALNPEKVKSIIIAGTPIDFQIDGGKCQMWLDVMPQSTIENIIKSNNGIWPGKYQLCGFKMLNPVDRYLTTNSELMEYVIAKDEKKIKKWIRNNSWYEYVMDLPGKMIKQVRKNLFGMNELIKGELVLFDKRVLLQNITCPIGCITGDDDDITLERQCTEIFNYVSSDQKIHFHIPNCGHIAIFLKGQSLEIWGETIKFVGR
jgi:poly(3-hydroxyalkanoate) synthetase